MVIMLLAACDTRLRDLTMKKTPYPGNELRIDGYYYSSPLYDKYADITTMRVAVFYRDGYCINTSIKITSSDTLGQIESEVLRNDGFIAHEKAIPSHIGVFLIMNPDIQFEVWEYRAWTFTYYGKIIDGTTFIINKSINNRDGKNSSESLTYRFKQFSPKPDSTNVWIK